MPLKQVANQQTAFVSSLPLTMELALLVTDVIVRSLTGSNAAWPYEDRVLVWLAPSLLPDAIAYHAGRGNSLTGHFQPHQVEQLDKVLWTELTAKIEAACPGMLDALVLAATSQG